MISVSRDLWAHRALELIALHSVAKGSHDQGYRSYGLGAPGSGLRVQGD